MARFHRRMKKAQMDSGKSIVDIAEALGISAGYLGLFIRTRDILGLNILVGLAVEGRKVLGWLESEPERANVWLRQHLAVWVKPGSRYEERIERVDFV